MRRVIGRRARRFGGLRRDAVLVAVRQVGGVAVHVCAGESVVAGRGPAPKQEGRRRRNVPMRGEWVDLDPLDVPVLPELDDVPLPAEAGWGLLACEAWDAWRADPVSGQWTPSDVQYAKQTIRLINSEKIASAAEIRQRMDALGLTPKGKRDLRFRLALEVVPSTGERKARVRELRAV